jgi:hypothetical protein
MELVSQSVSQSVGYNNNKNNNTWCRSLPGVVDTGLMNKSLAFAELEVSSPSSHKYTIDPHPVLFIQFSYTHNSI